MPQIAITEYHRPLPWYGWALFAPLLPFLVPYVLVRVILLGRRECKNATP